jgi:flavorubredoxin
MIMYEETTGSVFPADLFVQPGDQPAVVQEDLGKEMCYMYREVGIFAAEEPVRRVVDRIEKLEPQRIHPMHGGSLPKEVVPNYIQALRDEEFAFEGKIFGREIPR